MIDKTQYIESLKNKLSQAKNKAQLLETKNIFLKEEVAQLYKQLATSDNKKEMGIALNELKKEVEESYNNFLSTFINNEDTNKQLLDYKIINSTFENGSLHPINIVLNDVITFFKQMNFEIINDIEVTTEEYNFENLNIPKNHPARNKHDSFFIDENFLLRTHCTVTTAKKIFNNNTDDIRIMSYGNVYRKDDDDATHSHQFTQVDFVWINENINIANLKWIVDSLLKYLFNNSVKTRYRLSYFPFTEPSFEVDISCFKCNQQGCNICKKTGWIEILGAGLLNNNVLQTANIKNKIGLAGGIGIERIAMLKYGINNIRDFYTNNFAFIKQFKK